MADIEQQARELLAIVHESNGVGLAALIRNGRLPASDPTLAALVSALRAAPSVPERLTIPMRPSGCGPSHDYVRGWNACIEHIQASCTTLATVKPPRDLRTKVRPVAEMPEVL